jgi:hypothetical protein
MFNELIHLGISMFFDSFIKMTLKNQLPLPRAASTGFLQVSVLAISFKK